MKRQKQSPSRFEVGTHGGRHARICEFDEQRSPEPQVVRIPATGFDEALAYLQWVNPAFGVASLHDLGLFVSVSGSPLD
jgi:hypothetical protein